jgi:NAD(P)-dependent dehydrogenase (short-subunit alcohol dehydrogenase family)
MTGSHSTTALLTGASRGLGSVLATFLAGNGYDLILTARGTDDLREKANSIEIGGIDSTIHTLTGNVTDPDHRRELGQLIRELGGIDLLINNASALGPSPLPPLAEYPLDEFGRVHDVNVVAPLALVQELLPSFRDGGLIVNITSDAASEGYPGWGGYGASKAALELLTKTLANELDEVGVVVVDPGDMRTEMHQRAFPGEDITDRPRPDVTIPFWSWLFGQDPLVISGGRFQAQAEQWEVP